MEQIETQASDLRYLVQRTPVPLSDSAAGSVAAYETPQPHLASPGSASAGENSARNSSSNHRDGHNGNGFNAMPGPSGPNKRKSTDDGFGAGAGGGAESVGSGSPAAGAMHGQKQTRSKRNRYISIACNECKRRKIKCNGQTPCQRCGHLNLACLYAPNCCSSSFKDSDEYKDFSDQLGSLQDEVNRLNQAVKTLQTSPMRLPSHDDRMALPSATSSTMTPPPPSLPQNPTPIQLPRPSEPRWGSFRGPTSMAFSLDVANKTISNMGYKGLPESDDQGQQMDSLAPVMVHSQGDPILEFDKDEMVRLCQLHEEEVGIMYPVLKMQSVISYIKTVSGYFDSLRSRRSTEPLNDDKTLQLKVVICCALVVEEGGHSERAVRLYNSMEATLNRKLMAEAGSVKDLPILALTAGYRFLSNDEVLAWRIMGQVTRLCLELGIHQRDNLVKIQDEAERRDCLMTFWAAYVLDRRWSFATGLPYVLQDEDVDPEMPYPEEYPFLVAMITYSRLAAKVWRQVNNFGPVLARELRQEEIERLDREILQWYETVPDDIKMRSWDQELRITSTPSYNIQRLRIWTYLRLNQIRIWLYTPILHSATSIMVYPAHAQSVVDLSKDTIRYLTHLNNTTNLYRKNQVFYHQFLSSAIAVLFLASVHAPVRFSAVCREEFYLALELVKDLSAKSFASQRLWRTIKSLKDVAPRFGLDPDNEAHSNAATGMAGLARSNSRTSPSGSSSAAAHTTSANTQPQFPRQSVMPGGIPPPPQPQQHQHQPPGGSGEMDHNGARIQSEMSRIFEGYVGLNGFQVDDRGHEAHAELATPDSAGGMWAADGTVFPYFKEMF